jgi:hypothetical protein
VREDRRKRAVVAAGSVAATAALLALLFSLGSWAYQHRRFTLHERRLHKALQSHPTAAEISEALLAEAGTRAIAVPPRDEDLPGFAAQWSPRQVDDVLAKRRAASELRVFGVGDMVYFLFFDADGRLQSYVLMAN